MKDKFTLLTDDKWISGVCGGLGEYFHIDCKIEFNKNSTIVEIFIIFFLCHCYCRIAIFRQILTAVCFNYF